MSVREITTSDKSPELKEFLAGEQAVSINEFDKGSAAHVFDDLSKTGLKVIVKDDVPEAVILSPERYVSLIDEISDVRLLALATERMKRYDPSQTRSFAEIKKKYGVTDDDLKDCEAVIE